MGKPVKNIVIRENAALVRRGEPVRVSVPFARGELRDPQEVVLSDPQGEAVPLQSKVVGRWKDGSVQWLLCDFSASVSAGAASVYRLSPGAPSPPTVGVAVTPGEDSWRVDTGAALFLIDAKLLRPFLGVRVKGTEMVAAPGSLCLLAPAEGTPLPPGRVEGVVLENPGPLAATLCLKGSFSPSARFTLRLTFHAGKSLCLLELTLHNPRAARHPGGRWDLGDGGSFFFRELSLSLPLAGGGAPGATLVPEAGGKPLRQQEPGGRISIRQESSGGSCRLSPNHLAAGGRLACSSTGYRVALGEAEVAAGERALPTIWAPAGESGVALFLPRFWQEFPKGLQAEGGTLQASFFPSGMPEPYELQGGERKRTALWLDFDARAGDLEWLRLPLQPVVEPEAVRLSGVFPELPPGEPGEDLVDRFLPSPDVLFQRREVIDEYGWRNFGDFYADHEAVYHQGEEPFVSHYNNQYDLLAGLYRKFFATGDSRWGELACDLARHVVDIDLYHTDLDREEYNHGLFWHTDHYISAGLATHRTWSALHLGVKDPRWFGGGPAAEHCYSSGLLLSYYLTGNPDFAQAVLDLADWSYRSLAGPPLLLARTKKSLRYLSQLRHAKGAPFPRFPLTRGTGNAINASLDAFQLSGERRYLERAYQMIQGALHPLDNVDERGLANPEAAWSYTVLLGSVAKFLDKKGELGEQDDSFFFARGALLAYAEWMEAHEFPYLRRAELLEFPNETWAAQELRKCVVLYHAARYAAPGRRAPYLEKALLLLQAAEDDLRGFPTSGCTRPVALMLQNGWVAAALRRELPAVKLPGEFGAGFAGGTPRVSVRAVLERVGGELGEAMRESSVKREIAWFRARMR